MVVLPAKKKPSLPKVVVKVPSSLSSNRISSVEAKTFDVSLEQILAKGQEKFNLEYKGEIPYSEKTLNWIYEQYHGPHSTFYVDVPVDLHELEDGRAESEAIDNAFGIYRLETIEDIEKIIEVICDNLDDEPSRYFSYNVEILHEVMHLPKSVLHPLYQQACNCDLPYNDETDELVKEYGEKIIRCVMNKFGPKEILESEEDWAYCRVLNVKIKGERYLLIRKE